MLKFASDLVDVKEITLQGPFGIDSTAYDAANPVHRVKGSSPLRDAYPRLPARGSSALKLAGDAESQASTPSR